MNDELLGRVVRFISAKTRVSEDRITVRSALLHDLGVDGDDAGELLYDFAREFHVDMSGFEFSRYFVSEGLVGWAMIASVWRRKDRLGQKPRLTIGHLTRAVETGELR